MEQSSLITYALLIPLLPLAAYFIQSAMGTKLPRMGDWVSTGAIFGSFLCACKIFGAMWGAYDPSWVVAQKWTWLDLGSARMPFKFEVGVRIDNLGAIMLLMVTLCATLIHLFSTGYMRDHHGKPEDGYRYASFFSYLSLFTSAMLGLVISDNLLTLFMCWELMGLCSYLLIGFYRHKVSAANASLKAFMTTRVGDTGLFLGMLALFGITGSFRFEDIYRAIGEGAFNGQLLGASASFLIGLLIFMGTVGKSAQFPLQVWLPDAMEGPTPVSALIHAATMVAAGVYLILRMFPLLEVGHVLPIVAYVGAFTSLAAAILAIKQTDIKKILAYSTLSQLGYMVLAVGVGAYSASFMHLITHAVFKACLFMSSGAVIYAMHHEQNIFHMGGLRKKIPITFAAMLITTLAISGVPGFSGFVSKDKILAAALGYGYFMDSKHILLPIFGFITAGLTAFYMFRLIFVTFFGHPHDHHHYDEAHEVSWNMWLPLVVLAGLSFALLYTGSVTGGLVGHGDFVLGSANEWFQHLVVPPHIGAVAEHATEAASEAHEGLEHYEHLAHIPAMALSVVLAGFGILFSYLVYGSHKISAEKLSKLWPSFVQKAVDNLYYFDFFYIKIVIQKLFMPFSAILAKFDDGVIDRVVVDGWKDVAMVTQQSAGAFDDVVVDGLLVDGLGGGMPNLFGSSLRSLQNGKVQRYLMVAVGALILFFLLRGTL
ncbi:MAG: NADH-quinone oxidoreductase subunit L [Bdellovibrionales bacterium]|nr:NADH-quinone oxidoreductase subunit L [Bdellovibrionales bacterium]